MSYTDNHKIIDFFEYAAPALKGFCFQEAIDRINYSNKDLFHWISAISLPDFVSEADFERTVKEAENRNTPAFQKSLIKNASLQLMKCTPFVR
ncbi:MAG: hypothetical protein HFE90_06405 [Firmicutes bacterium]|nr:hypothetical protein [Bacillota bacterium]